MGITCKPIGRMKGVMRKVENELFKEKQIKRSKGKDKKDESN